MTLPLKISQSIFASAGTGELPGGSVGGTAESVGGWVSVERSSLGLADASIKTYTRGTRNKSNPYHVSITQHETRLCSRGHRIFLRTWTPQHAPKAVILIAHGMGEHSGRYTEVATTFVADGYAVVAPDHRGHGQSLVSDTLGDLGYDGWDETLRDMHRVSTWAQQELPNVPQILLGHSMGCTLAQQYIYLFGHTLHGCMMSGSAGFMPNYTTIFGAWLAGLEAWRTDPAQHSNVLQALVFGKNNNKYKTNSNNGFEWLSRDTQRVQAYVADPLCGFILANGSLQGMFRSMRSSADKSNLATIPRSLPIYILAGADDPLHNQLRFLQRMIDEYTAVGLSVDAKIYENGRHEMFNETNRDEVMADCLRWLNELVDGVGRMSRSNESVE